MNMSKLYVVAVLLGVLTFPMSADDDDLSLTSVRLRGMGGAGVAVTFDEHSLYTNPAGLSRAKQDFDLPRFRIEASQDVLDHSDDVNDIMDDRLSESDRLDAIGNLIPINAGFALSLSPLLSYTHPGFGIGAFSQVNTDILFKNRVVPSIEVNSNSDVAALIGTSMDFPFMEKVKMGISAGIVARSVAYDPETGEETFTYTSAELIDLVDSQDDSDVDTATATGIGINLGLLGEMPESVLGGGTWGVSIRNLGSELSGDRTVNGRSESFDVTIPVIVAAGVGLTPSLPLIGDIIVAADYQIISPEDNFFLNLNLGVEKQMLGDRIALRGGVNDGYIVGGIGIDLWIFELNYAVHSEELGDHPGDDIQTRHMLEFGFIF